MSYHIVVYIGVFVLSYLVGQQFKLFKQKKNLIEEIDKIVKK